MQAIVYALLSNGNEDFQHISNYSPFYEIDPHWEVGEDGIWRFATKFDPFHAEIEHHVFNTHLRRVHSNLHVVCILAMIMICDRLQRREDIRMTEN